MFSTVYASTALNLCSKWSNFLNIIRLNIKLRKSTDAKGSLDYIIKNVKKDQTIVCIGIYTADELLTLRKAVGVTGTLIVFVPDESTKIQLAKVSQLLGWLNVLVELAEFSETINDYIVINDGSKKESKKEAPIIDINDRKFKKRAVENVASIENFIIARNLSVDVIQLKIARENQGLLQSIEGIIKRFKPEVIAEYEANKTDKSFFYKAVGFFVGLHYKGFFVLDTLNIPLANFDFEIYQNPRSDFYCNTFVFTN